MTAILVTSLGWQREEPAGFAIDRPYGLNEYLLVRFHSPMDILTAQGLCVSEPGHCVLFTPGHPQWFQGRNCNWVNDWIHMRGAAIAAIVERHELPLNTLLMAGEMRFMIRILEEILREQHGAETGWEEAVDLLVRQLLLKLARAVREPSASLTPSEAAYLPVFRDLRGKVHEQLMRRWTVAQMAAEVGLSPSRFAALYQRFFGVSPLEDLLRARLHCAENLLTNRAMPVGEAAIQSGFGSLHYFSRLFHERVGCAPSDYHRIRPKTRS